MPVIEAQRKVELMMAAYRAIFGVRQGMAMEDLTNAAVSIHERWKDCVLRVAPRLFKNSSTGINDIPGLDMTCDFGDQNPNGTMKVRGLRFIAQNPNKKDGLGNLKENAILAQAGHRIMWVIDTALQNGFLGKVMDDQWIPNAPRAIYPSQRTPQAIDNTGHNYQMREGDWVQSLPNVERANTVNAVEEFLDEQEEGCEFIIDE